MTVCFPLLIGFTAIGVSIEHVVLSNQSLALPFAEKWLLPLSVSMCLFALGISERTRSATNTNVPIGKGFSMSLYGIIAAIIVFHRALSECKMKEYSDCVN